MIGPHRLLVLVALMLLATSCSVSDGSRTPDAQAAESADATAADSGTPREYGELGEVALHTRGLWAEVQVQGEWVEHHPTLYDLATTADIAALVRVVSAEPGRVIQGSAAEDVYCEINLNVQTMEVLRATANQTTFQVSFVLPRAFSVSAQSQSVAEANASLPTENVVVFLRWRDDLQLFRVVNGWGVWAETSRDPLDAPLNPERVGEGGYYAEDLKDVDTVPRFLSRVRDVLRLQ